MSGAGDKGSWAGELARPRRAGPALLWAGAAVLAFAAHAGAVALVLREAPAAAPSDGPPPAIMIELAAMPEATDTEETRIGEDQQDLEEVAEEPEPEIQPDEVVEPEPEPEELSEPEPEPEPEEIPEPEQVETEQAEVAMPATRPLPRPERVIRPDPPRETPRETRREQPQPQPRREQPQPQQNRAAAQQAQQSDRNAAPQASAGRGGSNLSPARWQSQLMAHLERRKRYPAAARQGRQQGIVHVNFTLDERGNVTAVGLAQSSGFPALDQAALETVRRASPVPAPPPGVNRNITAPMRFTIR